MPNERHLAEAVRKACVDAALEAYERGGISGLCRDGRWELAIQAIQCVDLEALLEAAARDGDPPLQ